MTGKIAPVQDHSHSLTLNNLITTPSHIYLNKHPRQPHTASHMVLSTRWRIASSFPTTKSGHRVRTVGVWSENGISGKSFARCMSQGSSIPGVPRLAARWLISPARFKGTHPPPQQIYVLHKFSSIKPLCAKFSWGNCSLMGTEITWRSAVFSSPIPLFKKWCANSTLLILEEAASF